MTSYYYIDTCSLKWRYLSGAQTSNIDSMINNLSNEVFTAELTILEWSSALAWSYRQGDIDKESFKRNEIALMSDIASNRLKIIPLINRSIERARYLIEYIGVGLGQSLKSGDAIHIIHAMELSRQIPDKLIFVTSDKILARIASTTDILVERFDSRFLSPV